MTNIPNNVSPKALLGALNGALQRAPKTGGVRFAPSPTGRFHIGNLRTAWISHQIAKRFTPRALPWVVRFEDIDRPRMLAGAMETQIADMQTLGLAPDLILLQSQFIERHWSLLVQAIRTGQVYACDCSRKDVQTALAAMASAPHSGEPPAYSGRCRKRHGDGIARASPRLAAAESIAWRFQMPASSGHDDFIVARSGPLLDRDGLPELAGFTPSYHWACAIDDFDGGYDWLVRGSDLAPAASLQRAIQSWLASLEGIAWKTPAVFHVALVVRDDGGRLEKRTQGVTLPELHALGYGTDEIICAFKKNSGMDSVMEEISQSDSIGSIKNEVPDRISVSKLLSYVSP